MWFSQFLSKSRYLVLIPVVLSLLASAAAFVWGGFKTYNLLSHLAEEALHGGGGHGIVGFIAVMDTFLIATALLVFALGMYELFIAEVEFPEWLVIRDLHDLKAKLGSLIILVMAVNFLEHLVNWEDPLGMLMFAGAITLVSAVLIAFGHFMGKD